MPFAFHYAARSDVGMVRSNNEDSAYAGPHLLALADGMGGHAGGDVASSTVIAGLVALDGEALSGRDLSEALHGQLPDQADWTAAGRLAQDQVDPEPDIHASADYRRHLVGVLTGRALREAAGRAV